MEKEKLNNKLKDKLKEQVKQEGKNVVLNELIDRDIKDITKNRISKSDLSRLIEEIKKNPISVIEKFKVEKYMHLAELENTKNQLDKDKNEIYKYSLSNFVSDLLPTIDVFEMVINSKNISKEVEIWVKGIELIYNGFMEVLERNQIKKVSVKIGDKFNYKIHNSIEHKKDENMEDDEIYEVINSAYFIDKRLLRPATVKIIKNAVEEEKLDNSNSKDKEIVDKE